MEKARSRYAKHKKGSWFTEHSHRWPSEALALGYAMACVEVVSQNSKRAGVIYQRIFDAWAKPETNELYDYVITKIPNMEIKRWKDLVIHPESIIKSDVNEPWTGFVETVKVPDFGKEIIEEWGIYLDTFDKDYPGAYDLIQLVFQFILVGFNRENEIEQGIYRVIPSNSHPWLWLAVMVRTAFESKNITLESTRNIYIKRKIKGKEYDFEEIMTKKPMSRKHRMVVATCKDLNMLLHHDRKFIKSAWIWYQCRVVHSGIEDYLNSEADKGNILDLKNIQKQLQPCDHASGYTPKGSTLD